jgi:hypothetical protein
MMGLAIASVVAATGLFVGVLVFSFNLLHGDRTADRPSSLKAVQFIGAEETVFSWARDRCGDNDLPDLPARAFRNEAGRVQLHSAHFANRRFVGPNLNKLGHPCSLVMSSGANPDPAMFNDREWLASLYTEDGDTVYALVHNEYQGNLHPGRCPSGEYFQCWYNAVTLAVSRNGGASFEDARPPPGHLVATVPYN